MAQTALHQGVVLTVVAVLLATGLFLSRPSAVDRQRSGSPTERVHDKARLESNAVAGPDEIRQQIERLLADRSTGAGVVESVPRGGAGLFGERLTELTERLATSLSDRSLLIVWALDQSVSARQRRKFFADRIASVYAELEPVASAERELLTGVVAFGRAVTVLTDEPVDTIDQVLAAVSRAAEDPSGKESVFRSVMQAIQKWRHLAHGTDPHNRNRRRLTVSPSPGLLTGGNMLSID